MMKQLTPRNEALALALFGFASTAGCGGATRSDAAASGGSGTAASASGGSANGGSANGGASAGGKSAGNGGGTVACAGSPGSFPEFDRSCSANSDCVLVTHTTSCCGAMLVLAVAASAKNAFDAAEAICDAQYPACGCAAQGVDVEDGTQVSWSWQAEVKAACDAGSCKAHYAGSTFTCGSHTCTDQEYCIEAKGGPAGTEPSSNCVKTDCADCSCLPVASACTCSQSGGHLKISCQFA